MHRVADILVIEDEPDNIDLLRMLLESGGHSVTAATTGEEGLSLAERETFGLLLVDLGLPGEFDGVEAVRRLRALPAYADVPIIVVTAFTQPTLHEEARLAGCDRIVLKPLEDLRSFLALVSSCDRSPRLP
ncbi:MAG: response regulator receiver sensor signal transduction histidine kinase [Labilithrix sp.]|nr:response regulator receiver sensor signal transduction histidine kinase [Labilithrix sp.]